MRASFTRLGEFLFRTQRDQQLADEIDSHLQLHIDDNLRQGLSPADARRQAILKLGGIDRTKELYRERRGLPSIESILQDLRFGARMLRRHPTFTFVATLTLALGIGMSTAMFGMVDTVLIRPLPYRDPQRLVAIYEGDRGRAVIAWSEFLAFARQTKSLDGIAAVHPVTVTVGDAAQPEQVRGALVSASLMPMLGIEPLAGRQFLADEDREGAGQSVLLSEGLWRRAYGGDPAIVGRTVLLDVNESWGRRVNRPRGFTVVGILPQSFETLLQGIGGDVWFPLAPTTDDSHDLFVIGKMKAGVRPEDVKSDLEAIAAPMRASVHSDNRPMEFSIRPVVQDLLGNWQRALGVLLGAVGFVLLIICVNVMNLILGRGQMRQREVALRAALGASRGRVIRQILTETFLLVVLGSGLAIAVAYWSIGLLASLSPDIPRLEEMRLDGRLLGFMTLVALLASLASGLAPALQLSGRRTDGSLSGGGRGAGEPRQSWRWRRVIVVAEVALALVLLIGAGLMLRTLSGLIRVDPGFDAHNVLTFRLSLPRTAYDTQEKRADFYERFFGHVSALPGVTSVGLNHALPFGGLSTGTLVFKAGSEEKQGALWCMVSPQYFEALRIPFVSGSAFEKSDFRTPMQTAIVDASLARKLWGDKNAVGEQLEMIGQRSQRLTVRGVVADIRDSGLDRPGGGTVYLPSYTGRGTVVVRGASDPTALAPAIRSILGGIDKVVGLRDFQPMENRVTESFSLQRFTALLLAFLAGAAALLGLVGLYGVISFSVSQRIHEIGVRMALGGQPGDVTRLVLAQGARMAVIGITIGLAGAAGLTRLLSALLFEVSPTDPVTFAGVAAGLLAVALLACYLPARRAAGVDPVTALRHD
jgi:putative ABC transport system permease protein